MKNKIIALNFLLASIIAIYTISCSSDKLPVPTAGEECNSYDATYDGDIKGIIDATCALAGCHVVGGGAPGIFENYAGLADFFNNSSNGLRNRVIVLVNDPENGMPPDWDTNPGPKDLTAEQFEIFRCWADSGFPEN